MRKTGLQAAATPTYGATLLLVGGEKGVHGKVHELFGAHVLEAGCRHAPARRAEVYKDVSAGWWSGVTA